MAQEIDWLARYQNEVKEHQEYRLRMTTMLNNLVDRLNAADAKLRQLEHELAHAVAARDEALAVYDKLRQRADEAESWCSLERAAKEDALAQLEALTQDYWPAPMAPANEEAESRFEKLLAAQRKKEKS